MEYDKDLAEPQEVLASILVMKETAERWARGEMLAALAILDRVKLADKIAAEGGGWELAGYATRADAFAHARKLKEIACGYITARGAAAENEMKTMLSKLRRWLLE